MTFPLKNIFEKKQNIRKILLALIFFLIALGLYIYNIQNYVIVRFDELGALTKNMPVFYNGFRIGKVIKIGPDKDFRHTLVKVNLYHKNLDLPKNTTVKVENFPNGELYLQFVYPGSPSFAKIKRGDMLEGTAPYSLEQFMLGQNISGVTDIVSLHVIQTLKTAEEASQEVKKFFNNSSNLIQENRKAIKDSTNNTAVMTKNLAQTAENLNKISKKLDDTLDIQTLNSTTSNVKNTTENILKATEDIDKTAKEIADTVSEVNSTAKNLNAITGGLKDTMGKRFAGIRIIFGTPIQAKNTDKKKCN